MIVVTFFTGDPLMLLVAVACVGIFGDRQGYHRSLKPHIITSHDLEYPGMKTLRCYAKRHGYPLRENVGRSSCMVVHNFYFKRVCNVLHYLKSTPSDTWVMFTDADVAVMNPDRRLEDFIDHEHDMVVYERFHNNEIMAGVYLVRHTPWCVRFLEQWLELRHAGLPNADNGALIALLGNSAACTEAGKRADGSLESYWKFVSICKQAMGIVDCSPWGEAHTCRDGHVKVLRRGHGPALDFFIMGPGAGSYEDQGGVYWPWGFLVHGIKPRGHQLLGVIEECRMRMPIALNFADAVAMMQRRDLERRAISLHKRSFEHCTS